MTGLESSDLQGGRVFFPGDDRLEGVLEWPEHAPGEACSATGGVVIAHPYPPHGATMAQPVVYRIAQSCRQQRLAALRFNFRGVGGSLGVFSGTEEYRDVMAAAAFLAGRLTAPHGSAVPESDTLPIALAGYSFGSIMAARAAGALPVEALALVAFGISWDKLPADTLEKLSVYRGPVLAVCPENDEFGYPEEVERVLTKLGLNFTLSVVKDADHFLEGKQREVGERVATFLAGALHSAQ